MSVPRAIPTTATSSRPYLVRLAISMLSVIGVEALSAEPVGAQSDTTAPTTVVSAPPSDPPTTEPPPSSPPTTVPSTEPPASTTPLVSVPSTAPSTVTTSTVATSTPPTATSTPTAPPSRPTPTTKRPGSGPLAIEIDISSQRLTMFRAGRAVRTIPVSTGNNRLYCVAGHCEIARTPRGRFRVQRRISGWRVSRLGRLYNPLYFSGGYAIHGGALPGYPASHGCVRIAMGAANWFPREVPNGTPVWIRD